MARYGRKAAQNVRSRKAIAIGLSQTWRSGAKVPLK